MTVSYILKAFHLRYPNAKGPPKALPAWLKAYNDGIDDYTDLKDNRVIKDKTTRT